jgi:hypothetical protein
LTYLAAATECPQRLVHTGPTYVPFLVLSRPSCSPSPDAEVFVDPGLVAPELSGDPIWTSFAAQSMAAAPNVSECHNQNSSTHLDSFNRLCILAVTRLRRRPRINYPGSSGQGNSRPLHHFRLPAVGTKEDRLRRSTTRCFMGLRREYLLCAMVMQPASLILVSADPQRAGTSAKFPGRLLQHWQHPHRWWPLENAVGTSLKVSGPRSATRSINEAGAITQKGS